MVLVVPLLMQQLLPILVSMYLVVCAPTKERAPFVLVKVVHWWELPWNAAVGTMLGVTCKMHKALRWSWWRHCYVIVGEKIILISKKAIQFCLIMCWRITTVFKNAARQHLVLVLHFTQKTMFKSGLIGLTASLFSRNTSLVKKGNSLSLVLRPRWCYWCSDYLSPSIISGNINMWFNKLSNGNFRPILWRRNYVFESGKNKVADPKTTDSLILIVVRHLWRNWFHRWTWLRTFWPCTVHSWQYPWLVRMSCTLQAQWGLHPCKIYYWSAHWLATCTTMWTSFHVSG